MIAYHVVDVLVTGRLLHEHVTVDDIRVMQGEYSLRPTVMSTCELKTSG